MYSGAPRICELEVYSQLFATHHMHVVLALLCLRLCKTYVVRWMRAKRHDPEIYM